MHAADHISLIFKAYNRFHRNTDWVTEHA